MYDIASKQPKTEGSAQPLDWGIFAALVAIGGSSFVFIEGAIATIPPAVVAVGRLWIGAAFLYAVMTQGGESFPPFREAVGGRLRLAPAWSSMLWVSVVGYVIPFLIFPWAQQFVESGLAGLYMAFMPLWTVGLGHYFAGERLTRAKGAGFALGFMGVAILMGGDALSGAVGASLAAQGGLALATLCYAVSVIISRRTPDVRPKTFACATVLGGAVLATPALLFAGIDPSTWSLGSVASVAVLGIAQTGLAGLLIIIIVQRVGAGFMAFANYLTPVWAVALGAALFHERLHWSALLALGVVLAGVAVSRMSPAAARPADPGSVRK
jgi:drug/metabolite transporter (DMT)-like permease